MRRLILGAIGLAALASAYGVAQAQAGMSGDSHGRVGFFMRGDANNDGVVTRQEWDTFRAAEFVRLDANHDGQLSRDEMRAGRHWGVHRRGDPNGGPPSESHDRGRHFDLSRLDANHDGNISRLEFLAGPNERFDRLDTNHDSVISASESQAAQQRMAERRAHRPNPDSNGDGVISRTEWDAMGAAVFERLDANHDGRVTREEAEAARPRRGE
ncbi:MAG: hypothetical protein HY054_05495 [Proteobacteria bacterium]|nr:hypothetical protein [Pseudomonadota bacterium]